MKLSVKVKTGARVEQVEQVDDRHYLVAVKARPVDGRANEAVCRLLGRFFGVAPSAVRVIFGQTARRKIVEVPLESNPRVPNV